VNKPDQQSPLEELTALIDFKLFLSTKLHFQESSAAIFSMIATEFRKTNNYSVVILELIEERKKLKIAATSTPKEIIALVEKKAGLRMDELLLVLEDSPLFKKVVNGGVILSEEVSRLMAEFQLKIPSGELDEILALLGYSAKRCTVSPIKIKGKCTGAIVVITTLPGDLISPACRYFTENLSFALELVAMTAEQELLKSRLRISQEMLQVERDELKRNNIALKVLLKEIETAKKNITRNLLTNINMVLLPIIDRMEKKYGVKDQNNFALLRRNIEEIASPFRDRLSSLFVSLSPRELQVCDLVKNGLSSKEIAGHLAISVPTVHRYREHIRRKVGIANKEVNLTAFLNSDGFTRE
jgi:DNA-binding CsgD family transcriptional regulator